MPHDPVNASVRLAVWGFFVVLIQFAPLPALLAGLIVIAARDAEVRRHWWRLLRRSRWLLVVLASSLALVTPGEYLLPGLPLTAEGLTAALHQGVRLIAMLGAVAFLLATTPTETLVGGLLGLLPTGPAVLGRFSQRAALRLALVLRLASTGTRRPWRQWLDGNGIDAETAAAVSVTVSTWRLTDVLMTVALAVAALLLVWLAPGAV